MQAVIDKQLKDLAAAPGPTMGFHVRWGDKIEEDILFVSHFPVTIIEIGCNHYIAHFTVVLALPVHNLMRLCLLCAETAHHAPKGLHRVLHQELPRCQGDNCMLMDQVTIGKLPLCFNYIFANKPLM